MESIVKSQKKKQHIIYFVVNDGNWRNLRLADSGEEFKLFRPLPSGRQCVFSFIFSDYFFYILSLNSLWNQLLVNSRNNIFCIKTKRYFPDFTRINIKLFIILKDKS